MGGRTDTPLAHFPSPWNDCLECEPLKPHQLLRPREVEAASGVVPAQGPQGPQRGLGLQLEGMVPRRPTLVGRELQLLAQHRPAGSPARSPAVADGFPQDERNQTGPGSSYPSFATQLQCPQLSSLGYTAGSRQRGRNTQEERGPFWEAGHPNGARRPQTQSFSFPNTRGPGAAREAPVLILQLRTRFKVSTLKRTEPVILPAKTVFSGRVRNGKSGRDCRGGSEPWAGTRRRGTFQADNGGGLFGRKVLRRKAGFRAVAPLTSYRARRGSCSSQGTPRPANPSSCRGSSSSESLAWAATTGRVSLTRIPRAQHQGRWSLPSSVPRPLQAPGRKSSSSYTNSVW